MLEYIKIEGYKSIKSLELELTPINIFIGSNGSGKSNLISFFKMVHTIFNKQLQRYVIQEKADNILHFGRKKTEELYGKLIFTSDEDSNNAYYFKLNQTDFGGYIFKERDLG